jgi:hypothetical protein
MLDQIGNACHATPLRQVASSHLSGGALPGCPVGTIETRESLPPLRVILVYPLARGVDPLEPAGARVKLCF